MRVFDSAFATFHQPTFGSAFAVAIAGVVGKPDPERTEIVKAFIVLEKGFEATPALASEI